MPARSANAVWEGDLRGGKGTMKFANYSGPYTFASRFETGEGTNPEELIAAAHAGCFSMAFSNGLAKAGFTPTRVATTATVYLEKVGEGFGITRIELNCEAQVPGINEATFQELANGAKQNCPVSKLVTGAHVSLTAKLIQ